MIKLYEVQGKTLAQIENGAYYRCFGNLQLAQILSKVQSLIIKNGYELERMVTDMTADRHVVELDDFLSRQIMSTGTRMVTKPTIKKSKVIQGYGIEPDFMIFQRIGQSQMCYVVELKDGHEFDTKSSAKEHANLHQFITKNADPLRYFQVFTKIVGFNAKTKEEIRFGFKNKIDIDQAMTGRELCALLDLDYDEMLKKRANDREANLNEFIKELTEIPEVRSALSSFLSRS